MLNEILQSNKKYFNVQQKKAPYEIKNGTIDFKGDLSPKVGQYILIQSTLNFEVCKILSSSENVYKLDGDLQDDTTNSVCLLAVPASLVKLTKKIEAYQAENENSVLVSESFGGWSGTKATGKNGLLTWQEKFADSLKPYKGFLLDIEVTR